MNHHRIRLASLRATVPTFLLLALAAARAGAGPAAWTRTGPLQGGIVTAVAVDPTEPSRLYLGTRADLQARKLFRSVDRGETWTAVGPDPLRRVKRLAVHPHLGSTVYAVVEDLRGWVLYRSRDSGDTWTPLRSASDGMDVAIDPSRPSRLIAYAAVYCEPHCDDHSSTILESADGGDTWSPVRRVPAFFESLEIDPLNASVLWAVTSGYAGKLGPLAKSVDGGRTWRGAGGGRLENRSVLEIAVDPARSGTVYASTWPPGLSSGGDLFKSVDGGASWRSVRRGLGGAVTASLVFHPRDPAVAYAGTWNGVFATSDGGATWRPSHRGLSNPRIEALAVDPRTPAVLYAGTAGDGVFKSADGGVSWRPKRRRLELPAVASLAASAGSPSVIFAGTEAHEQGTGESSGIYRSADGGRTWQSVNRGLPAPRERITTLAVDPGDPAVVYAAPSGDGVYKSIDGGSSWSAVNHGLDLEAARYEKTVFDLAIDPRRPATLYAATHDGVYKSSDGAGSWRRAGAGLPRFPYTRAVAVDPQRPATVYAAVNHRVYRSDDGAATWSPTGLGGAQEVYDLAVEADTGVVYAGTDAGVHKSADRGLSWISTAVPGNGGARRLEVVAGSPGVLYAADAYTGLYRSTDGGASWTALAAGSPGLSVNAMAVVAEGPVKVLAGFRGVVGVYEWDE